MPARLLNRNEFQRIFNHIRDSIDSEIGRLVDLYFVGSLIGYFFASPNQNTAEQENDHDGNYCMFR